MNTISMELHEEQVTELQSQIEELESEVSCLEEELKDTEDELNCEKAKNAELTATCCSLKSANLKIREDSANLAVEACRKQKKAEEDVENIIELMLLFVVIAVVIYVSLIISFYC